MCLSGHFKVKLQKVDQAVDRAWCILGYGMEGFFVFAYLEKEYGALRNHQEREEERYGANQWEHA